MTGGVVSEVIHVEVDPVSDTDPVEVDPVSDTGVTCTVRITLLA
jgi:hypothetical protein